MNGIAGMDWAGPGVVTLPGGARVRGRRLLDEPETPADFAVVLADGPRPNCAWVRVDWPDFWIPRDTPHALAVLRDAHRRAYGGERVEVACQGGTGRTGTALAALAMLDGHTPAQAVAWVRAVYRPRAVETPWQRWWLRRVR